MLFGGGENYTKRFPSDIKSFVRKRMLPFYPQLADARIDYGWGGTLAVTMNRMPCFGRLDPEVYYAMGFSGHGVQMGTLAGKLIAEAEVSWVTTNLKGRPVQLPEEICAAFGIEF